METPQSQPKDSGPELQKNYYFLFLLPPPPPKKVTLFPDCGTKSPAISQLFKDRFRFRSP